MARSRPAPLDGWEGRAPPPFLALPYPFDEYLDALPGDYGKVARRLLRAACWQRQATRNGIELDAGEVLCDERSEELWGGLVLDRDTTAKPLKVAGRRALVRRVLERLEVDEVIARRSAQPRGPGNGPNAGPRNGPSPTVVRFLKFREILWPASAETAQETTHRSAQEPAQQIGPILPVSPPDPPRPSAAAAAHEDQGREYPALTQLADALGDRWGTTVVLPRDGRAELEAAVEKIGLEAAFMECHDDAVAAHRSRRIDGPPTSLGFCAPRLLRAAARLLRAAGGSP